MTAYTEVEFRGKIESFPVEGTETADLLFSHCDNFALVRPASTRAADWLGDTLPEGELLYFRGAIVVSPEQINPIITAARCAGLTVEG